MAFDYAAARDTADSLLADFGQVLTLRKAVNTGGSDWEPTQTSTDYTTKGVIIPITRWYPSFTRDGQSDVLRTDQICLIAMGPLTALGVTPTSFDQLVDAAGAVYKIIDAKPLAPAGTAVIYKLQLRT